MICLARSLCFYKPKYMKFDRPYEDLLQRLETGFRQCKAHSHIVVVENVDAGPPG